jgi:hypothetical protein
MTKVLSRNKTAALIFFAVVLGYFLYSLWRNSELATLHLLAKATNETIMFSIGPILLLSLSCPKIFFWKFFAAYLICSFAALVISYWAVMRGGVPLEMIARFTMEDYLHFLKLSAAVTIAASIPLRLLLYRSL